MHTFKGKPKPRPENEIASVDGGGQGRLEEESLKPQGGQGLGGARHVPALAWLLFSPVLPGPWTEPAPGMGSVWAGWEVLSVFLNCSCLWGMGKNESDTIL